MAKRPKPGSGRPPSPDEQIITAVERALTALDDGDLDGAQVQLGKARKLDPDHPEVLGLEAALAEASGDDERALATLEKLADLVPDDPMPLINIAEVLLYSIGDAEAALPRVDAALELV